MKKRVYHTSSSMWTYEHMKIKISLIDSDWINYCWNKKLHTLKTVRAPNALYPANSAILYGIPYTLNTVHVQLQLITASTAQVMHSPYIMLVCSYIDYCFRKRIGHSLFSYRSLNGSSRLFIDNDAADGWMLNEQWNGPIDKKLAVIYLEFREADDESVTDVRA